MVVCDARYQKLQTIEVKKYQEWLLKQYRLEGFYLSFRQYVSLFSRVYGKENNDVAKPLHSYKGEKPSLSVERLIKVYGEFEELSELKSSIDEKEQVQKGLKQAFKAKLLPEISAAKYRENEKIIADNEPKIESLKTDLGKYAINLSEILNEQTIELKKQKDDLLDERQLQEIRLRRVERDLGSGRYVSSKNFSSIVEWFGDVNVKRLEAVEQFHSDLSGILKNELQADKKKILRAKEAIEEEIEYVDIEIDSVLRKEKRVSPKIAGDVILDRAYGLIRGNEKASSENTYYDLKKNAAKNIRELRKEYDGVFDQKAQFVTELVNSKLAKLVKVIYDEDRQPPVLSLQPKNYTYLTEKDTGTGKAFANLLLLDLVVFSETKLPFLIHDSLLYKNVENNAVSGLVGLYLEQEKQSFISIDEIEKYGTETAKTLRRQKVIELSDDELLYIKDWRERKRNA